MSFNKTSQNSLENLFHIKIMLNFKLVWLIVRLYLQWKTEILDFCPSTRILIIGCKTDLRTDVCTLMELSNQKQSPITYEQVRIQFAKNKINQNFLRISLVLYS